MPVMLMEKYPMKTFPVIESGLSGISREQMEVHYKLFEGYVNNTNTLIEKISKMVESGKIDTPEYSEIKRRLGFEFNGMRLHEYYFDNMIPNSGKLEPGSRLYKKVEEQFGSYSNWEQDFKKTGAMRGIGWVILYQDPMTGRLFNFWVTDHENGHPAGFQPILVMDVWEHAYTVDWKATDRSSYIDAFFKNINWKVVESRLR